MDGFSGASSVVTLLGAIRAAWTTFNDITSIDQDIQMYRADVELFFNDLEVIEKALGSRSQGDNDPYESNVPQQLKDALIEMDTIVNSISNRRGSMGKVEKTLQMSQKQAKLTNLRKKIESLRSSLNIRMAGYFRLGHS